MVKAEYVINNVVINESDPMMLELRSIEHGNMLLLELNNTTITAELQLRMIRTYFHTSDVSKADINGSDKLFRESIRHYFSITDEYELHAIVEFSEWDYTIQDIITG